METAIKGRRFFDETAQFILKKSVLINKNRKIKMNKDERIQKILQSFNFPSIELLLETVKHSSDCNNIYCRVYKCCDFKINFQLLNNYEEFAYESEMRCLCLIHSYDFDCVKMGCRVPFCDFVKKIKQTIDQNDDTIENYEMNKGRYICRVCGASANCFNFDVKTCEACKAFFRRNAEFEQKHFVCKNGGNCDINESTRNKCRKCRIEKCLRVGMRKDWIMTEMELITSGRKKMSNENLKDMISSQPQTFLGPVQIQELHITDNFNLIFTNAGANIVNENQNQDSIKKIHRKRRRQDRKIKSSK